jgi:hypothetical protein
MKRHLLLSTAAILTAGIAVATAQTMPQGGGRSDEAPAAQGRQMGPERGAQTQDRVPRGEPGMAREGAQEGTRGATPNERGNSETAGQRERGNDQVKEERRQERGAKSSAQEKRGSKDVNESPKKQSQQKSQEKNNVNKNAKSNSPRPSDRGQTEPRDRDQSVGQRGRETGTDRNGRDERRPSDAQDRNRRADDSRQEARGSVSLTTEQRTRVQQSIFSRRDIPRVDRVNFSVNVGIAVPARVRVVEVPTVLIDIYPEWRGRGYRYFVVDEDIVIVDRSRRIVDVVAVSGSGSPRYGSRSGAVLVAFDDLDEVEIREIQLVLIRRGFFRGQADGVFTPRLREALLTFQRREGITVRGSIDTRTVTRLGLSQKIQLENRDTDRRANSRERDRGAGGNERDDNNRSGSNQRDREPGDRQGNATDRDRQGDNPARGDGGRSNAREDENPRQRSEDANRNSTGQSDRGNQGTTREPEGRSENNRGNLNERENNRGNQGRNDGPQRSGSGKDAPR